MTNTAINQVEIGIIGGSGFYNMAGLTELEEVTILTPYGTPSDTIMVGTLEGKRIAFLPRHGLGHRYSPTEVPMQANIYALKSLGVRWIISISAVGSLKKEIAPLDIVIPDQIFDRTVKRERSFFSDGIVAHVSFAEPFCPVLRQILYTSASNTGTQVHNGGTYICIEGPQFSTKAESNLYRQWGMDIIGMTALPEAKLAREAEIHYATIACATDYDCWYEAAEHVTVEMVIANLLKNVARAQAIIRRVIIELGTREKTVECNCADALATAIITNPEKISPEQKKKLALLLDRYLAPQE